MEASCLEIASVISILLKDALALIRIVNSARSSPDDKNCVTRLYQNLKSVEAWAQSEWSVTLQLFVFRPRFRPLKLNQKDLLMAQAGFCT